MAAGAPRHEDPSDIEGRRSRSPVLARVAVRRPERLLAGYLIAVVGSAVLVVGFLPIRNDITPLSKGFGFLVVVVISAAVGGLWPGILASFLGFIVFNFFFIPPYGTFVIGKAEDVVVLFVFLGLSILISALLARALERADAAEAHEVELRTLQGLSAELVSAVPGRQTYRTILTRLLDLFGFPAGSIVVRDSVTHEARERVTVGHMPKDHDRPGVQTSTGRLERLPLSVGGRVLGELAVGTNRSTLAPAEQRVLRAFSNQLALVLERDRLLRAATEAEVLRQADHVRRSLLATVSHDLRSPLAAIKASVTDLLDEEAEHGPVETREALESIDRETDRLASLVANLLDMSRIEGGILKPRIQAVDLDEIVSASVDRIRHEHPELSLTATTDEDTAIARADPVFLDRVLANVLDNAAKASHDGRSQAIEVEAVCTDGTATVRVIDHGVGLPRVGRDDLFTPFSQLGDRDHRTGTGLGLAISKGLLSLMNGAIWFEDTPGGGATVAFSLPTGHPSR